MIFNVTVEELVMFNRMYEHLENEEPEAGRKRVLRQALHNEYMHCLMQEDNYFQDREKDLKEFKKFKVHRLRYQGNNFYRLNLNEKGSSEFEMEYVARYYDAENDTQYFGAFLIIREWNRKKAEIKQKKKEERRAKNREKIEEKLNEASLWHLENTWINEDYLCFSEKEYNEFAEGKEYFMLENNIEELGDGEYIDKLIKLQKQQIKKYYGSGKPSTNEEWELMRQGFLNKEMRKFKRYLIDTCEDDDYEAYELLYLNHLDDETSNDFQYLMNYYRKEIDWINEAMLIKFLCNRRYTRKKHKTKFVNSL